MPAVVQLVSDLVNVQLHLIDLRPRVHRSDLRKRGSEADLEPVERVPNDDPQVDPLVAEVVAETDNGVSA
jgi:hypothetical protein